MPGNPLFAASLTPYRALDRRGVRWIVALAACLSSIPGIFFFAIGAWPVIGFMGLDVLALYWAMSASLDSGRAYEEITLWPDNLLVRRVSPKGRETKEEYNPFFVRFDVRRDGEDRVIGMVLTHRGRAAEIGAFLNPDDKASFARSFGQALGRARA
jgi:uncharacterized membrane protein